MNQKIRELEILLKDKWYQMRKLSNGNFKKFAIGSDGMGFDKFEATIDNQIKEIARKIFILTEKGTSGYKFAPLLYFEKKKNSGGTRKIFIPRIKDQLVLKYIHDELLAALQLKNITLRTESPLKVLSEFRKTIQQYDNPVIVRTDLSSFFDTIPRERVTALALSYQLPHSIAALLKGWSEKILGRPLQATGKSKDIHISGLPQGLSISAALAELWGFEIERLMRSSTRVFRYVDDIAFVCNTNEEAQEKLKTFRSIIKELGLEISEHKTSVSNIDNGIPWLGMIHYKNEVLPDPERIDKWFYTFYHMRKKLMYSLRENPSLDKNEVLNTFYRNVKKELRGHGSSRAHWYSITKDQGQWREMDKRLHAQFKMIHKQLGIPMDAFRKLPSIHNTMVARGIHNKSDSPHIAD